MSPPRRPRGEKPRTTIRYLQRQITNLQTEVAIYRQAMGDRDKAIEQRDAELSDAADRERIFYQQIDESAEKYVTLLAARQKDANRLNFLEGYYAKSTETIRTAGEGDSRAHPYGAQAGQEVEPEVAAGGNAGKVGGEVRRNGPDNPAPHYRRSVDEATIAGAARDATTSELERHRR